MNILKRIWNYLFPEKHGKVIRGEIIEVSHDGFEPLPEASQSEKVGIPKKKAHKISFSNQQLVGKVLTYGKDRFRIHRKISSGVKFKYDTEKLR